MTPLEVIYVETLAAMIRRGAVRNARFSIEGAPRQLQPLIAAYSAHDRSVCLGTWELESVNGDAREEMVSAAGGDHLTGNEVVLPFARESSLTLVTVFSPGDETTTLYRLDFEYQQVSQVDSLGRWLQRMTEGHDDASPSWSESLDDALYDEEELDRHKLDRMPELRLLLAQRAEALRQQGHADLAAGIEASLEAYRASYGSLHHPWPDANL